MTGGREYGDQRRVDEALDFLHAKHPIEILIHGDCPNGVGKPKSTDQMAADWARRHGIPVDPYPARWDDLNAMPCVIRYRGSKPYNVLAGPNRNTRMLIEGCPHLVAVFPGDRGTADCRAKALKRGIAIVDIDA